MMNIIKGPKVTWVDIQNPVEDDIRYLKKKFNFHPLVLGELIPPGHRPKVEHHSGYLFMSLHYPAQALGFFLYLCYSYLMESVTGYYMGHSLLHRPLGHPHVISHH